MLHAWESERARAWLMGNCKNGELLGEIRRQAQSILVVVKDLSESQHVLGGTKPLLLLVLPVMMLAHGVKVLIMEVVHELLSCALTQFAEATMRAIRIMTPVWKAMRDKRINDVGLNQYMEWFYIVQWRIGRYEYDEGVQLTFTVWRIFVSIAQVVVTGLQFGMVG